MASGHYLSAFEFVSPSPDPQIIRLKRGEIQLFHLFAQGGWLGYEFVPGEEYCFLQREDLVLEHEGGPGVVIPYWNGVVPHWQHNLGPAFEQLRIANILTRLLGESNA
jgi:hypothetical protein